MRVVQRFRIGHTRSFALALALLIATAPTSAAATRTATTAGSSQAAAADDDRIADLARSLDFELERIFRFVADEIRYEPYSGILRGAIGTLDAGAGNSLDQALLLAALLEESGIPYRFARGSLDDESVARLIDAALMDEAQATAAAETALGGGPYPAPARIGPPDAGDPPAPLDPQEAAAVEKQAQTMLETSDALVSRSVTLITTALADGGIVVGEGSPETLVNLIPSEEVAAHTWVQAAQGPTWLDLDPTLGTGAAFGMTMAEVDQTLDHLPDALRHRVRFEVLLEQVHGDELGVSPVIEYEAFADELAGEPITLAHIPPNAVQRLGVALASLGGAARVAYHPILIVPEGTLVSTEPVSLGVSGGPSDVTDVFDIASAEPKTVPDGEASAEWISVTVEAPGMEPVTSRRPVFDRVPAEVRYGGQPTAAEVQPVELVTLETGGRSDFAPLLGSVAFAISTGPTTMPEVLSLSEAPNADLATILASSYLGLRDALAAHVTITDGVVTFVDRPGVVSYSTAVSLHESQPTLVFGLDIWHRSLGAMPTRGTDMTPASAKLEAGVLEHIAERIALGFGPQDASRLGSRVGVSSVLDAAAEAEIPILVLQGSIPTDTTFEQGTHALIETALLAGDVVIVPAEPVRLAGRDRLGWWRIDPVTGMTADSMDDGTASEMAEISPVLRTVACAAVALPALAQIASAYFEGIASRILGAISGYAGLYWAFNAKNAAVVAGACLTGKIPA